MTFSLKYFLAFLILMQGFLANAQEKKPSQDKPTASANSLSLNPQALSAKSFLEDLLSRRYSQELSSITKKEYFNLGVQLDLDTNTKTQEDYDNAPAEEPISDLLIGHLDPESLLKKVATSEQQANLIESFLQSYKIKNVSFTLGVSDSLGAEGKTEIETWLQKRVSDEFGTFGKSSVVTIRVPASELAIKKEIPEWLEKLEKFQSLIGQLAFALCLLVGVLLWKMLNKPLVLSANGDLSTNSNVNAQNSGEVKNEGGGSAGSNQALSAAAIAQSKNSIADKAEYTSLSGQILQITPKIKDDLESIIRSWCQGGDEGLAKLACYAEIIGQQYGKLPIPIDAMSNVSKAFTKMIDTAVEEKNIVLQKAYWDLLSVLNLGAETLERPFGYISQANFGMMQQVLVNQNVKMQTLVSLFMSEDQRSNYLNSLSDDSKISLLKSAAELTEVDNLEFRTMDLDLKTQLRPQSSAKSVSLDLTLNKLAQSLSCLDQIKFLPQINSPLIVEFKKSFPTLAFIHEWSDQALQVLLSRSPADEVMAYISLKPECKERMVSLCPPFTAELLNEEFEQNRTLPKEQIEMNIKLFNDRLTEIINSKEVYLSEIFSQQVATDENAEDKKPPLRVA